MNRKTILQIEKCINDATIQSSVQSERLEALSKYQDYKLKRKKSSGGVWHYTAITNDDKTSLYLGSDDTIEVAAIKEYRYLKMSTQITNRNIKVLQNALRALEETDYDHINSLLPKTYRNPTIKGMVTGDERAKMWKEKAEALKARYGTYKPEELTVTTDDGNLVRSKSEGMIYNYLLSAGVTFVYELPMKLRKGIVWPDFTVLSEHDYETEIIIEHQGMMGNEYYRKHFADKVYKYIQEGYVQGNTIFFTFDSADGGLDIAPVKDVVRSKIKALQTQTPPLK